MEEFAIVCLKCGEKSEIETRDSVSYRNDTSYEYPVAVCKRCRLEERIE